MTEETTPQVPTCRVCGCTDNDCTQCIEATGVPCYWIEPGLCSACSGKPYPAAVSCTFTFGDDPREQNMKFSLEVTGGDEEAAIKNKFNAIMEESKWEDTRLKAFVFSRAEPKPEATADPMQNWERVEDPEQYTDFEEIE